MKILISTLKEELATSKRLERRYAKQLKGLPQGSFVVRTIRNKKYGYLTYRDGEKVRQKYLGPVDEKAISFYRNDIKNRKEYKEKLKSVRGQIKVLKRALRGKAK